MKDKLDISSAIERMKSYKEQVDELAETIDIFLQDTGYTDCDKEQYEELSEIVTEIRESMAMNIAF